MIRKLPRAENLDLNEIEFQQVKTSIHEELVASLDLTNVTDIDRAQLQDEVQSLGRAICQQRRLTLNDEMQQRLESELVDEVFGLGPLEPLMQDPTISDVLVNGPHEVFVERFGQLEPANIVFADDQHVLRIIQRIVSRVGRRIDEASPMVDARLEDGSRINAIIPPLSLEGPKLSIRRFDVRHLMLDNLRENGSLDRSMEKFLSAAVGARISMMISGGTGAGKTTLLNALSAFIPDDERVITVEDSAELILQNRHVVTLETRNANTEGKGEVRARELVRNSLRMRPDRIVVGEVRGGEALDMLQAMNTGHEGSLTTIHANDTLDALSRLEMMVAMTGVELPIAVVRQYVSAGIRLIVHLARLKGGQRKIVHISELVETRTGEYQLQEIFGFRQKGLDDKGRACGEFYSTGYRPKCADRCRDFGVELEDSVFTQHS